MHQGELYKLGTYLHTRRKEPQLKLAPASFLNHEPTLFISAQFISILFTSFHQNKT